MELIIVSDIHVAKAWDKIDKIIPKKINFLNPNYFLRKVVKKIRNQKLIINGDLVDYFYSDYNGSNNWDLFFNIMSSCKGKYFCSIGNHDYRSHPYNFSIYGLNHVNIPTKIRKKFSKQIGYNKFKYLKELKSITVNPKKFNALQKYPFKKFYYKTIKNAELIFLNTGPDAFTKLSNIFHNKLTRLFADHPLLKGLTIAQIKFLNNRLKHSKKKTIIIFLHAPPFFSLNNIPKIKINKNNYYKTIKKKQLDYGIFLDYNWKFVNSLIKSNKNIIVINSHTETPKQYILEKLKKIMRDSNIAEINNLRNNSKYIKFISTLPLGAIYSFNKKIGFLRINKKIEYIVLKEF